ncbi:unnamed protein product [Ascophyllum nodosum]
MDLPRGWESGTDPTGRLYYTHVETGKTQWEPPTAASAPSANYGNDKSGSGYVNVNSYDGRELPAAAVVPVTASSVEVVVDQPRVSRVTPPPGAPEGGRWVVENHCGLITWMVGIFVFWFVCCCPCDERSVYIVEGVRYNSHGAVVHKGCCVCCGF